MSAMTESIEEQNSLLNSVENDRDGHHSSDNGIPTVAVGVKTLPRSLDDDAIVVDEDWYSDQVTGVRKSCSVGDVAYAAGPKENVTARSLDDILGRVTAPVRYYFTGQQDCLAPVRLTEVVPANSNIIDYGEDHWQLPISLFSSKRRGKSKEDKKLNRRVRSYYRAQDDLISAFENIQMEIDDTELQREHIRRVERATSLLSKVTFFINFILLIAKAVAVALSNSMSIIGSLVDSAVDLLSGVIIWWTSSTMKKRDPYYYPEGRTRLEPVAIIILSVIMSLASIQLIIEATQKIIGYSGGDDSAPTIDLATILIASFTIAIKLIMFFVCHLFPRSNSVKVIALDNRNDVLSNTVAIICGYLGSQSFMDQMKNPKLVYIDPIGAILISIYILLNWWKTGYKQIRMLTGYTARPDFLSKLTWISLNHHRSIEKIDTVRAFHFGNNFLVEVDIVLPENMSLKEAHDIGETLQQKLENFPTVERAFVHLDFETEHYPTDEHKIA